MNAPHYADGLPCPVEVLPFQSQIFTGPHPCGERYRKHGAMWSRQSSPKKGLRLFHSE